MSVKILVVDDDEASRQGLASLVSGWGHSVDEAADGEEALAKARAALPSVVITDLVMPKLDGLALLRALQEELPFATVILLSGQGSIDTAVTALKEGAYDFLTKPVDVARLKMLVPKAVERAEAVREVALLRRRVKQVWGVGKLVGTSAAMQEVYRLIELAAPTPAPVLITGESGTGKELVARTIHERSNRRQGPFVAINCAAIPETLIESEIFGHERGAFTGAIERRLGCFELADRGTLFLDEIAEMEVSVQAKLLRILQDNAFRRVGGREELHVDVRIIAATNQAPADALAAGKLREDLFYRLNVFPISLPPLRQRPEDVLPLARTFIEEFCAENARHVVALAPEAEKALLDYPWPGNVRELRNAIQRAVVLGEGALLTAEHLSPAILATSRPTPTAAAPRTGERIRDMERRLIVETLEHVNHDKTRAAVLLGISPKTLYNKIARYKIRSVKRSDAT